MKNIKRLVSLVLVVIMLFAVVPLGTIGITAADASHAVDAATATSRTNALVNKLNGKYFTTTQATCGNSSCNSCKNSNIIATSWLKNTMGLVPDSVSLLPEHYYSSSGVISSTAWSCAGFANYALWYIYAQKSSDNVRRVNIYTGYYTKSDMDKSGVRTGDVIRVEYGSNSGHSFIYISHDSTGVTVLDSNWDSSRHNLVQKHVIKWTWRSGSSMAITRGKNWTAGSGTHTHSYVGPSYEKAHPHKKYMSCSASDCDAFYYTNEDAATYSDPAYEGAHPHNYYRRCTISGCDYFYYTGEKASVKTCSSCWNGSITASPSSVSVEVGKTQAVTLNITGFFPDGAKWNTKYDSNIVSVTNDGLNFTFKGVKTGSCNFVITIYSDSSLKTVICSKTISVKVTEHTHIYGEPAYEGAHPHNYYRRCTVSGCDYFYYTGEQASVKTCSSCWHGSFTVSPSSVNVEVGKTQTVTITANGFFPDGATWGASYNNSIVSVTNNGQSFTFKGLKKGGCNYVITAYSDSNKKVAICSKTISVTVEDDATEDVTIEKIRCNTPDKLAYYIGETLDTTGLVVEVTYSDDSTKVITSGFTTSGFSSSTSGTKTVTVSYGGKTSSFEVYILTPEMYLSPSSKTLNIGESFTATATTEPSGKTVTWRSGDTSVATVTDGKITAVGTGSTSIYASFTYNGIKYETKISVTVTKPAVTLSSVSVKSLPNKTNYYIGDTLDTSGLSITAKYSDGTIKTVTSGFTTSGFSSSTAGTKTVTVSYDGKSTTFTVKVIEPSISINTSGKTLKIGESFTATATTTPTGQAVTWKTGNTSVATVSNGKITAVGEGSVSIYATFTYNGIKYETKMSVTVEKPETVLNSVSIKSLPNKTVYYIGDTINTNGLAITAKYSDGSVKTVTTGLTVSGFNSSSKGTKTVTVSYSGKTTTFEVAVKTPSVTLALESKSLTVGDVYTLSVTSDPKDVTLMWSSYDANIASVSNGKVTAKAEGEVIIKVKFSYNGNVYSDTCTIKIKDTGCKHNYTTVYDAVASTCTIQGHNSYTVCDDCKEVISGSNELLPLSDHIPGEYVITREPTCNVVGIEASFCTGCGKQLDRRQIPVLEYVNKFTDVKPSHWFYDSVNYVARKGFMSGMSETKFSPNTELTREQFIQILFAMEGKDKSNYTGDTGFVDVPEGRWYSPSIKWAKEEGVSDGVGNGKFGIGANVTREQMAKFMKSFAEYKEYNTEARGDISVYKDANKIASWSKESMQWCVGVGIYESTSKTEMKIEPRLSVKRSVAATVIMRFVKATSK